MNWIRWRVIKTIVVCPLCHGGDRCCPMCNGLGIVDMNTVRV